MSHKEFLAKGRPPYKSDKPKIDDEGPGVGVIFSL
jgi:hypothetical protein